MRGFESPKYDHLKVVVAAPMHDRPTAHFTVSLVQLMILGLQKYDTMVLDARPQVSDLALARNRLVASALELQADKLLFVDDDMMFTPEQALRIIEAEGDVVSACYRKKTEKRIAVGYRLEDVGREPERDGFLMGMACVGMGLTSIDLRFLRVMLSRGKVPTYVEEDEKLRVPALFEFKYAEDLAGKKRHMGEDEVFCKNVITHGGRVWLHTDVEVGHVGTYVYR
jgi:hypothetical protein